LIPGVVCHAINVVEHPELVAGRIVRFAKVVGRENLIAGANCGWQCCPKVQSSHTKELRF
jgi:5-methyltetrahydropteroyltriglutamate--homocysteine methyltransferase